MSEKTYELAGSRLTTELIGLKPEGLPQYLARNADLLLHSERPFAEYMRMKFREKGMSVAIIGPKSSTWTQGYSDPAEWTELFEPDLICTADGIAFRNIVFAGEVCTDRGTLIREQRLTVNPDYPRTIPRGGTGYGVVEGVKIL